MQIKSQDPDFFSASTRLVLLILSIGMAACSNKARMKKYLAELLKDVDKVQIQFFIKGDTLTQTLTSRYHIDSYKQVIDGRQMKDLKCDSTGRFLYFVKDTLIFEAYFSTPSSGSKYKDATITYYSKPGIYKTHFTYGAYMIADECLYEMKKAK